MTSFVGLGPMPGRNPHEAAEIVIGECLEGHLTLPTLPARGFGADAVGRTAALMADLVVDRGARSWKVADRRGRASALATDYLHRDIDACEEAWGRTPQKIRLTALGPWTMATSVENAAGHLIAVDRGAVKYFAQSLAAGLASHIADVRRRFDSDIEVLLAEPALGAVVQGKIKAPSMLMGNAGYLPAQGHREIAEIFLEVTGPLRDDDIEVTIALSSPDGLAVQALADSGAAGVWLPRKELTTTQQLDFAAAVVGADMSLELGIVPVTVTEREEHTGVPVATPARALAEQAALFWDELGYSRLQIAESLNLAPMGGFAASSNEEAQAQLGAGRNATELLRRAAGDLARDE
ncbi:methionine synthase [Corynebacterium sp. MSK151]|uniref:methionine synthase n=1 Tax=Corynebacterium TaxID=1716 RepID=UPI0008A5254B|nr:MULTISPECIES: methionine synthase [Corynebacterium]MBC6747600.1 methionine synthase [Corynebacterium sp. LK25]MBC6768565.1 methionine synthase [Corynebacterium sp. LK15]KAA9246959.1 methionine synthase [Corynebacterium amycolatum]MBC6796528.1 methionine synthase [Corynebacterium sp. LK31]MDK6475843.1 methionine synthase [Corynebacterium amycolatum]